MIESIQETYEFVRELCPHGFAAALVVSVLGPLLGRLLFIHRQSMFGLALPPTAALGTPLAYLLCLQLGCAFSIALELAATSAVVAVAAISLAIFRTHGRATSSTSAIIFLLATASKPLLDQMIPIEFSMHHAATGQIYTVSEDGLLRILVVATPVLLLLAGLRRPLALAAIDADEAQIQRHAPRRLRLLAFLAVGIFTVSAVPVVGAEFVLAQLLIPSSITAKFAPSQSAWTLLAIAAGILGTLVSFVLAVAMNWPFFPAAILGTFGASLFIAALGSFFRRSR